jgi:YlmC/YmxH family sporulation protein
MFRGTKLRQKEVINIRTAERLGIVSDVEINEQNGNIEAIIVPKRGWFFAHLFGAGELVIPWENIEVVGKEIILVRLFDIVGIEKKN